MNQTLRAPNGHHVEKSYGKTNFDGPLENLPYPDHFDVEAAIEVR